ncbi:MAG: hypothetical protein DHS20C17_10530 [Cyclobacteriaceae bacterium]|nr:MAG: hypothetical protein DHS20C17_10530 [Cyclobacteriaceae bacterium]
MLRNTWPFEFLLCLALLAPYHGSAQISDKELQADKYFERQLFEKASELYQKALKKVSDNEILTVKLARTNFMLDRIPEAYVYYSSTIHKRYLVKSQDYLNYALVLQSLQKFDGAQKWALKYLQFDPRNEVAQNLLISLEQEMNHLGNAQDITWL